MPITEAHVFGWEEATTDEKLEGLHDWCNILTAKLQAAGEETRALLERIKKLESEAFTRTGVRTSGDRDIGAWPTSKSAQGILPRENDLHSGAP